MIHKSVRILSTIGLLVASANAYANASYCGIGEGNQLFESWVKSNHPNQLVEYSSRLDRGPFIGDDAASKHVFTFVALPKDADPSATPGIIGQAEIPISHEGACGTVSGSAQDSVVPDTSRPFSFSDMISDPQFGLPCDPDRAAWHAEAFLKAYYAEHVIRRDLGTKVYGVYVFSFIASPKDPRCSRFSTFGQVKIEVQDSDQCALKQHSASTASSHVETE